MTRYRSGFVLVLALSLATAGCRGGGGGSPTAATAPELVGSVVPLFRFSEVRASTWAPEIEDEDRATLGPDSTSFSLYTQTRSAEASGDAGINGSGSSRATISQGADFTLTGAGRVSAWTVAHTGNASATSNFGTSFTIPSHSLGRSQFVFHFRVDEPDLVLVIEGGHRLEGDSAGLDVSIVEESLDRRRWSEVLQIDLRESDVEGPGEVSETLVLREGHVYEVDVRGLAGAYAQAQEGSLPVHTEQSVSESILDFSIVELPEE